MTILSITASDCPSVEELAREWSIVIAHLFPNGAGDISVGYLGRIVDDGEEDGRITLCDPFNYHDGPEIRKAPGGGAVMGWSRTSTPFCGLDVGKIRVTPMALCPLAELGPKQLDAVREALKPAWDGRAELRKKSGRLHVVDDRVAASTLAERIIGGGDR